MYDKTGRVSLLSSHFALSQAHRNDSLSQEEVTRRRRPPTPVGKGRRKCIHNIVAHITNVRQCRSLRSSNPTRIINMAVNSAIRRKKERGKDMPRSNVRHQYLIIIVVVIVVIIVLIMCVTSVFAAHVHHQIW